MRRDRSGLVGLGVRMECGIAEGLENARWPAHMD